MAERSVGRRDYSHHRFGPRTRRRRRRRRRDTANRRSGAAPGQRYH